MGNASPTYLAYRAERMFLFLSFGIISLIGFESLAVATAMPTVVESLDGRAMYALAVGVPMAAQLLTVSLAGPWSDSIGPRSCLCAGLALFSGGLLAATAAPSMSLLVLGRAVQGLGGGLCVVPLYAIIGSSVRPTRQPQFFAAFAAAWILPGLIGPAIAGFVVARWSWRWIFGVVPILVVLLSPAITKVTSQVSTEPRPLDRDGLRHSIVPATVAGIAVALLQVTSGTNTGGYTLAALATVIVAAIVSIVAIRPLLPAGTFTSRRGLGSTILLRGTVNGTFIATEAYLPLMLKENHGWPPFQAGLVLTISSVTWALGSWYQGKIASRKILRLLPVIGATCQLVGICLAIPVAFSQVHGAFVLLGWLIAGTGCGLAYPGMSVHALALTPLERKGQTSSALQLADTFGAAFSIAISGLAFALLQPSESLPFVGAIGLMAIIQIGAVVCATRIQPVPGSAEALRLHHTYSLDNESDHS